MNWFNTNLRDILVGRMNRFGQIISAIILAIIIGALIIYINGDDPLVAYQALIISSLGSSAAIASTLSKSTPLILTGLCATIAFRSGVINIGGEGQLYMGAIAGAIVGVYITGLPAIIHLPLALIAGALAGFIWAAPFEWFKVKYGTDELVTTTLANYIAILFTTYLVTNPLLKPGAPLGMTRNILPSAYLPKLVSHGQLNVGFLIAVSLCVILWFVFFRTTLGYELRMVGSNPRFSRYIGISVGFRQILAMGLSGALAGLGGAIVVLGIQHRFIQNLSPGWGFDGILIALLAGLNPLGVLPMGLLFGILKSGGLGMEAATNVPSELSEVLQSIIIFFVAAEIGITMFFRWRNNQKVQVEESLKMGTLDEGVFVPSDQSSFSDGEE